MGSYAENALYQKSRITLIDLTGRPSLHDASDKPLPDSELPRTQLVPIRQYP